LGSVFALPLSVEAFQEFQDLSSLIESNPTASDVVDTRRFVWGDRYTPSKYYNFLFSRVPQDVALKAIWDSRALLKLKVFLWTLMIDRLNTRDIMLRKQWNIESSPECSMCNALVLETRDHLFFDCEFAKACWDSIGIN
jgi:hypothetical protein